MELRGGGRGRGRGRGRRGGGGGAGAAGRGRGRRGGDGAAAARGGRGKGPRLDSRLLRQLDGGRKKRNVDDDDDDDNGEGLAKDFYEYEEGIADEESGKNRRYDDVEHVEYELPSDFEDEEIDEDAALGDEDAGLEETINSTRRQDASLDESDVDLNSDEEEDESGSEDDEESDGEGDEEEEESEEEEGEEEEEDADEKHQQMLEAVTGKPHQLRNEGGGKERKKEVRSEAYTESEYNLNPNTNGKASAVSVEDLLGSLKGASGIETLRKRMKPLQKEEFAVSAPLPKVLQDRVERKAGYEKSKDEVAKWQSLVKKNREAPSLAFNEREALPTTTVAALADKHKPLTDMEKEVAAILEQSNMVVAEDIEAAEALELNKLSVEEVRERQQRLSKMRSLLFQHEAKSKRVAKIKSKTFRKLDHSKRMRDFMETGEEAVKEAALKQEEKRAEERMTLKHKNTSRWARRILKRGLKAHEDGTRDAIMEQLRAHSMLTKKIQNANSSESDVSSSSSSSDEEDDDEAAGAGRSRSKLLAKAKAATLEAMEFDEEADVPKTGLFALPFMARAMEKKRNEAREEALAILEQLEQAEADEEGGVDGHSAVFEDRQNENKEAGHSGRLAFGDLAEASRAQSSKRSESKRKGRDDDDYSDLDLDVDDEDDDDDNGDREVHGDTKKRKFQMHPAKKAPPKSKSKKVDPQGTQKLGLKSSVEVKFNSDEVKVSKLVNVPEEPTGKQKKKKKKNKKKSKTDTNPPAAENGVELGKGLQTTTTGVVDVSLFDKQTGFHSSRSTVTKLSTSATLDKNTKVGNQAIGQTTAFLDLDDEDDLSNDKGLEVVSKGPSQEDLIRQAFAGDDVEADFQNTKSRAMDEEIAKVEEPKALPGWGQWTYAQRKRDQFGWKEDLEKKRREEALKKRKDAKLKFVVISEKSDKKGAKYHASKVPFPMKTKEVFEQSLRMPIGREYNGEKVFRDMIRPAELKTAGVIIDPIKPDQSVKRPAEAPVMHSAKRRRERLNKGGK